MPPQRVRTATAADAPALARTLTRAFADDPFVRWMLPRHKGRERRMERMYRARLATLLPHDLSWTAPGHAGAALWAPPDAWRVPLGESLRLLPTYFSARLPLLAAGWHAVERRHPRRPHLYLAILGVDPGRQGTGVGSALMAPALDLCDREGVGAHLESSSESNVPFYERHGFRVTEELTMPRGPRVWLMWREPR